MKYLSLLIILFLSFSEWFCFGLVQSLFSSLLFHEEVKLLPSHVSPFIRGLWMGAFISAVPFTQIFSAPFWGALSDQKGCKKTLQLSLLVVSVGYFLSAFSLSYNTLSFTLLFTLIGRFIVGLGAGSTVILAAALGRMSSEETKFKNFGLFTMATSIGLIFGPFIGGLLVKQSVPLINSFSLPFFTAACLSLFSLTIATLFFVDTSSSLESLAKGFRERLKSFKVHELMKEIKRLFVCVFIFCFGWSFYWEFISVLWIKEYGVTPTQVSHFYAYSSFFYAVSSGVLLRFIHPLFNPWKLLKVGMMATGVCILTLLLTSNMKWNFLFLPLQQILLGLIFPTALALVSNATKEQSQGSVIGLYQSLQYFAYALSPLFSGIFVSVHVKMPIYIGGALVMASGFLLWFFTIKSIKE